MSHTIINPLGLYNPVGYGFSHIAAVSGDIVFIAGQGANDVTEAIPPDADFAEQVRLSLANVGIALNAVGLDFSHVVQLRTFIVDHDLAKLTTVAGHIRDIWGDQPPTQTLIGVAALALPTMLFGVDAIAARP